MGLQHLVLRKMKYRALFNYLQEVNWKQILINLNVKAIQLLQKKEAKVCPFFTVHQVTGVRTFSIVLSRSFA